MEYYPTIEKNETLPFATRMDLPGTLLGQLGERQIVCYHLHMEPKNKPYEYNKTERDSQLQRTNWWLPVGRDEGGGARRR